MMSSSATTTPSNTTNNSFLGPFVHNTPLAPHSPELNLASHCIREAFGPTVQLVADALQNRGEEGSTLRQLLINLQRKCPTDTTSVRASLLVLIQHSIVTVVSKQEQPPTYHYHAEVARCIPRYCRFSEYIKKAMDVTAACVIETLLVAGRMRTVDVVLKTVEYAGFPKSDRYTERQTVVDAFWKLVSNGFVECVSELKSEEMDEEAEFEPEPRPTKRVKIEAPATMSSPLDEDPAIVSLLESNAHYNTTLPRDAVWRVNIGMFHDSLRAYAVGRLVSELYGQKVQSAGSFVTAALKLRAHKEHVESNREKTALLASDVSTFAPHDIVKYLPKPVLQLLEKKAGGVNVNLSKAWQELSKFRGPVAVHRIGEADRYEIAITNLLGYLRERIVHQVIHDRHGQTAARIVRILSKKGWLESDTLADDAMVPAKDTREILHTLYRSGYIDLFQLSASRQYNPASTIYLWQVHQDRLLLKVTENVAGALWHIRLRRQHEEEVGKDIIDRAHQADDMDENEHDMDKIKKEKFSLGLERLDCALQQLDDTLMVLKDFN